MGAAEDGPGGLAGGRLAPEVIEGYTRPIKARDWDRASLLQFKGFGSDSAPDLSLLPASLPITILQGEVDTTTPTATVKRVHKGLQQLGLPCEYVEVAGCGHLPADEEPAEFVRQVLRHVK